jgi:hypothetical protein
MLAIALHGQDLLTVAILLAFVAFLLYRILRRDPLSRIVKMGLFVERKHYGQKKAEDSWSIDPLDAESVTKPVPLPPPTPPPPLPPRPDDDDEATQVEWPKRDEA